MNNLFKKFSSSLIALAIISTTTLSSFNNYIFSDAYANENIKVREYLVQNLGINNESISWDDSLKQVSVNATPININNLNINEGTSYADSSNIDKSYREAFNIPLDAKIQHGFYLTEEKNIDEKGFTTYIYKHIQTGARLMYVQNDDTNKTFSISFATPAEDNTGVNHILEHSVLDGSKNYPVKSPFNQMSQRSLNTFLNAFTSNDFTMFPVSSINDKDFQNLMSVYLDAVFYPNAIDDPKILAQEGWHYDISNSDTGKKLNLNGVVYNEMKGNYSNPDVLLGCEINKSLYPNTSYSNNSGGVPDEISNLTKEHFIETYKKNYNPTNSYIYLYGKLDIDDKLAFINDNYLNKLQKGESHADFGVQPAFEQPIDVTENYPVSKDDTEENKTYITRSFVVGDSPNVEDIYALSFLSYLLTETDASPLKKAFKSIDSISNISSSLDFSMIQPNYSFIVSNTNPSAKDLFVNTLNDTLQKIADEGFDKDLLDSAFNSYEFSDKSSKLSTQQGLSYAQLATIGWLYSDNPNLFFEEDEAINKIKQEADNGYFQNLIKKYFLSNNHAATIVLKPQKGLLEEIDATRQAKAAEYMASLSENELNDLVKQDQDLKAWQQEPDSSESLSKLPTLSIKDIDAKVERIPTEITKDNGITNIRHNLYTNDIAFMDFKFDVSDIPQDKIIYLPILLGLYGKLDTQNHKVEDLSNKIASTCGDISFSSSVSSPYKDATSYTPLFNISSSSLYNNIPDTLSLISEILNTSNFEDEEKIKLILNNQAMIIQNSLTSNPQSAASVAASAYFSDSGKYYSENHGLKLYEFINDINSNFDTKWPELKQELIDLSKFICNRQNLIISCTADENAIATFNENTKIITDKLEDRTINPVKYIFDDKTPQYSAYIAPSQVQYIYQVANYKNEGYKYSGKMSVLENILNSNYMWQKIRVKGGAYGGGISFSPQGNITWYSYRDPNLAETLDAFRATPEFLKDFSISQEDLNSAIIGTIGSTLSNLDVSEKAAFADNLYLSGATYDDIDKEYAEILSTTPQDIKKYMELLEKVLPNSAYSVAGNEDKINANKNLFTNIEKLIK